MTEIINKDKLFSNKYKAVVLCEYEKELDLLRTIIDSVEKAIEEKEPLNTFSYEGICYRFAKAVVDCTKAAYDNLILGHYAAVFMIARSALENRVFLDLIYNDETQELWKYYHVYSTRKISKMTKQKPPQESIEYLRSLYKKYNIDPAFYAKRGEKSAYIDRNYGWAYRISEKFTFGPLCKKCNRTLRGDFSMMSNYSHGTDLYINLFDFTNEEHIMNMISFLYFRLHEVVVIYCPNTIGIDYNCARDELDELFYEYYRRTDKYNYQFDW